MFGNIATPATASTRNTHATGAASPPRWLHSEQSSLQLQSNPFANAQQVQQFQSYQQMQMQFTAPPPQQLQQFAWNTAFQHIGGASGRLTASADSHVFSSVKNPPKNYVGCFGSLAPGRGGMKPPPPRLFGSAAAKQSKSLDNAVLRFGSGGQTNGRQSAKQQHRSSKQKGQGVFSSDGSEHRQATASSSAIMTSRMSTNFDNFRLLCAAASEEEEGDGEALQALMTVSALLDRLQSCQTDLDARSKDDGLGAHDAAE